MRGLGLRASGLGKIVLVVSVLAADARAEPGWQLAVPERIELAAGDQGTLLPISISIDRGLAISKDAGIVIDLAPEGALEVKRRRLGRADAVDPDADSPRFQVPLHAQAAGDYRVRLHVRFWVCGQKSCRPVDARRTVAAIVSPPAPAPTPAP